MLIILGVNSWFYYKYFIKNNDFILNLLEIFQEIIEMFLSVIRVDIAETSCEIQSWNTSKSN